MVVMGAVLGAVTFMLQGSVQWDGTHVATSLVMLALLCAMFFIPAVPGAAYEVRGNGEMFPLNGPSWSLFFEYIGNLLYALVLRRLSTRVLTGVVVALGVSLAGVCHLRRVGLRQYRGGVDARHGQFRGWAVAHALPLLDGVVALPTVQTGAGSRRLLDLLAHFAGCCFMYPICPETRRFA